MCAKEFRQRARAALRGHWGVAIAVGLVYVLLAGGNPALSVSVNSQNTYSVYFGDALDLSNFLSRELLTIFATILVVMSLLTLVIGGCTEMGYVAFHTNLIRGRRVSFVDLFSRFHRIWAGICMVVLRSIFVWLWSLLLVIPGIIAIYRYAMMPYLMAEFPDLGALDAMRESKRLMQGNKWRLFCLELSFIGWYLLSILTLGIGLLWLLPYVSASRAAFYLEITGRADQMPNPEYN